MDKKTLYSIKFKSVSDINGFFEKSFGSPFVKWFNSNIAGKGKWAGKRITNEKNWASVWQNGAVLFGKPEFSLVEFICMNSIILNETGGTYVPLSERVGNSGTPGLAYAFSAIPGTKRSYNTLETNRTAKSLFNDPVFVSAHGSKPFADLLSYTQDPRWEGPAFPLGFSGKSSEIETDPTGARNGFLAEADFYKFRGRGFIQTTGRSGYLPLIKYVLDTDSKNDVLAGTKAAWLSAAPNRDLDKIATVSTNKQWDDLFQKTGSLVANYAVRKHALDGGAKGIKNYFWVSDGLGEKALADRIRDIALSVAGANARAYADLFYSRVSEILETVLSGMSGDAQEVGTQDAQNGPVAQDLQEGEALERTDTESPQEAPTGLPAGSRVSNLFPATIKPKEIRFALPPQEDLRREIADSIGYIPFVWYNSYQIRPDDIYHLSIGTGKDGIPYMSMVFVDGVNLMRDKGFPLDDSVVSVFINPRTSQIRPVRMDYKITKFAVTDGKLVMSGMLDVDGLYLKRFASYANMTSHAALAQIARQTGMGFSSNVSDTDDAQTWINTGKRVCEFMEDVVSNSYMSDETFMSAYIDFYYNLTYVDIEKELSRDIKEELGVGNIGIEEITKLENREQISNLFLTNDAAMQNSNSYFVDYRIINGSTMVSLREGYLTKAKFYGELEKDFLVFDIDSISSKGDKLVLKGSPGDDEYWRTHTNVVYCGKLDSDNMHRNYHYSGVQNRRNLTDLEKVSMEITMKTPNYNLYKYQKIYLLLSNQASTPSATHINNRLTGEWLIIDLRYTFDGNTYKQTVRLIKRELEIAPDEAIGSSVADNRTNRGESEGDGTGSEDTGSPIGRVGEDSSATSPDGEGFLLTKEIYREIYRGKVSERISERYYPYMVSAMKKYGIDTPAKIAAFLSQINAETGHLRFVTELSSGEQYEGRSDLGNTQGGDGVRYKGRGLIQITGRNNYAKAGKWLKRDFVGNPESVAAENSAHAKGAATDEQVENSIMSAVYYWIAGSAWGNLNEIAGKIDASKPLFEGFSSGAQTAPNTQASGKEFGTKKNRNWATANNKGENARLFTLICFGVNGGYNGYRERLLNYESARKLLVNR